MSKLKIFCDIEGIWRNLIRLYYLVCMQTLQWKPQFMSVSPSLSLSLSLCSQEGEEIPGEGAASCCSLPAGTDRPPLSACLQISYRDVICLAAWLNAHLLTRLRLCVCMCACVCVFVGVCMLTSSDSSQLEWRLPLYLLPCDYRHTENDRWTFTTVTRYLQIWTLLIF